MCGEVAAQQCLVGWDVQQQSHGLHIEPGLQNLKRERRRLRRGNFEERISVSPGRLSHHQASVHTTASQVGSVFSEVHRPQPLHHPMVGPLGNLCWRNIVLWAPSTER